MERARIAEGATWIQWKENYQEEARKRKVGSKEKKEANTGRRKTKS